MVVFPSVDEEPLPVDESVEPASVSVYSVAEDVSSGVLEFSAQAEKMRRTARAIAKAPPQTEGGTGLCHGLFPQILLILPCSSPSSNPLSCGLGLFAGNLGSGQEAGADDDLASGHRDMLGKLDSQHAELLENPRAKELSFLISKGILGADDVERCLPLLKGSCMGLCNVLASLLGADVSKEPPSRLL